MRWRWLWRWLLLPALAAASTLPPDTFEAAFQGRCGSGSPCEQLCRELHDGTFECGCGPGYVLHVDGYGCLEINTTRQDSPESGDVLYQKDVAFSAELEVVSDSRLSVSYRPITTPAAVTSTQVARSRDEKREYSRGGEAEYPFSRGGEREKEIEGVRTLVEDGLDNVDMNLIADDDHWKPQRDGRVTTQGPSLEQKVPDARPAPPGTAAPVAPPCRACPQDGGVATPRFSGTSWLALPALRGAYKRVRLRVRFRPERARGVVLLTGEHDDLSGDYLALVLRNGHVELRFDCGSGAGTLRSPEPVRLGRWNVVSVYRHRWDAWLRLNTGKRVRGRSKGLFSRMTFRSPVWVGGAGNTSGLLSKLQEDEGLLGCVDALRINQANVQLLQDSVASHDLAECAPRLGVWRTPPEALPSAAPRPIVDIDDLVRYEDNHLVMRDPPVLSVPAPLTHSAIDIDVSNHLTENERVMKKDEVGCQCEHGGDCVGGACLCPLGYAGEACEITLDLKVPRFNGSSYLRLPSLGSSAESWLDIEIVVKPSSGSGLLLYDAAQASGDGDFFSLQLRDYFVEFAMDLGDGIALVRSGYPLDADRWHRVSVSRSGRHASLRVRRLDVTSPRGALTSRGGGARVVTSRGAASALTLGGPLWLGGAPQPLPPRLALRTSFSGCVAELRINGVQIAVVSAALGGVNVDNCDHQHHQHHQLCSDTTLCKESEQQTPQYPQNISQTDVHAAIVAKKGLKHKTWSKKHSAHMEKYKRKKYYPRKKDVYRSNEVTARDARTSGPGADVGVDVASYPSFSGRDSYIHIDDDETVNRLSRYSLDINVRFRASSPDGLVLWSGRAGDFLALGIEAGILVFRYSLGGGEVVIAANHSRVDDGLWHRARATRSRLAGVLEVDGLGSVGKVSPQQQAGNPKPINTHNGLYIGGLPSIELSRVGRWAGGLVGCVSVLSLSGDFDIPLSLASLPHTITSRVGRCEL